MSIADARLSRRQVLQGLLVVGIAATPGVARLAFPRAEGGGQTELDEAGDRLVALISKPFLLHQIGRRHLAVTTPRPTREDLVRDLLPVGALPGDLVAMSDAELRSLLTEMIRTDLGRGRTSIIDGWMLSDTEMKLAALVVSSR